MEYKNSPIYDEYPDHVMVERMCDSICGTILAEEGTQVQSLWGMSIQTRLQWKCRNWRREMERIGANSTLPSEEYDEDGLIENSRICKGEDDRFTKCGRI